MKPKNYVNSTFKTEFYIVMEKFVQYLHDWFFLQIFMQKTWSTFESNQSLINQKIAWQLGQRNKLKKVKKEKNYLRQIIICTLSVQLKNFLLLRFYVKSSYIIFMLVDHGNEFDEIHEKVPEFSSNWILQLKVAIFQPNFILWTW